MEYFGITDKGRVRPTNQDIYRIEACPDRDSALVLVCDGMGGANAGNVASRFAAECFVEEAKPALETGADEMTRHETLRRALDRANDTVFGLAGRQPEFRGMGTTLVSAPRCIFVLSQYSTLRPPRPVLRHSFFSPVLRRISTFS